MHIATEEPSGTNKAFCKLISEEFVGSMVTLFLEDAQGHEFKVQMQERELSDSICTPEMKFGCRGTCKALTF